MGLHRSAAGVLTLTLVVVTLAYENVFINLRQRQVIGFSEFITFLEPIEDDIAKENLNVTTIYNTKTDTSEDLLCSAKALLKIDMSGPFSGVALQLSYSRPRLWTFHMSDSIFARGYGESELNAGAELHIFNRQMRIYSSRDPGYKEASIDGDNLLRTVDNVIQKRSRVKLDLTESSVSWDVNTNKSDNSIQSRYLFHWKNQSRRYLYLGLNRAVGMPIRQGNGLCSVTIIFPNTRDRRDHCTTGSHNCDKNAVCRPKKTNFRCICKAGFRGNGQHCIDIDECSTENVNCVHKCENTMGSYRCACHPGFKLEQNGFNCIDVDECALSNGGCEQQCANTIGSFQCLCDTKFRLAADGYSCVRTTPNSYDRCGELACDQGCDAIMGLCYCETGYTLLPDGKICVTDTCAVANGGCQHTCLNTPAGPICACASGYHLDIDGKSCEASCLVNNGGCDHQCEQNSGEVYCSCQPGYRLGGDQHSCHDIDECEEKGGECQFACRNLDGDYECYCPVGYLLHPNQHSCIDVDECEFQSACEHTCINTPGSYYCECRPGYTLLSGGRCARETECSMANGNCQRGCDDFLNGHKCTCPSHSLLHPNGKDCIRMKSCNVEDNSVYQVDNSAMCYSHSKGLKCAIECRNGLDMKFRPPGSFQFICAHRNNCDKRTSQPLLLRFIVDSCNVSSWLQPAKTELQRKSDVCLAKLTICSLNVTCKPANYEGFQFLGNKFILTVQIAMSSTSRNEAVASIAVAQMAEMIEKSMEQVGLAFRHKMSEYHFRPQQLSTRYVCPIMRTSRSSDSCMVCGPGSYFEPRYGHCLPCLYGTYQSGENSLFCRLCPSVLKVSEFGPKGAKSLSQCPGLCKSGFVSQTGLEPCRPCNFGSYQPDVGRTTCVTCGRGISTDLKGSRHFTDCQIDDFCKPGQHYSIFSAKCELCARGFYQPTEGQNFCIKCPLGTTTDAVGTVDKQQCKRRTCEGDTSGPMGYFQSPNYPSEYPSNVVCNWEIGPFKRRRILLVIPEIQLADSNCEDYLVIRKNSSPYSLLSFESCESKSQPQAFVARSKRISVEFRSDSANTAKGFRAHYVTYDESYHRLIEDIIRDSRLYSFQGHDQILQNKKLLNSLFEVIAEPSGYHKYANVSQSIFPKSFIDLLAPKVQRFFQIFGGV